MPRLAPSLVKRARGIHPFLPLLLRPCRELSPAQNELRWLREYVLSLRDADPDNTSSLRPPPLPPALLQLCRERALGKPLQYILGDQPFGPLNIKCRKGVLIPRPETETYTTRLSELLIAHAKPVKKSEQRPDSPPPLRILDLCTGSGCIALLLHALLAPHFPRLSVLGLDISARALRLANENLRANVAQGGLSRRALQEVRFERGDVLKLAAELETATPKSLPGLGAFDLVISNPPYISETLFWKETERSVRNWEPKTALVPEAGRLGVTADPHASLFYGSISRIASAVQAKLLVAEIGQREQIGAFANLFERLGTGNAGKKEEEDTKQLWTGLEVWCDGINDTTKDEAEAEAKAPVEFRHALQGSRDSSSTKAMSRYTVLGSGNERAVLAWRGDGGVWLGRGRERGLGRG